MMNGRKKTLEAGPLAIKAAGLSKIYKLYNRQSDRLKELLRPGGKKYHQDFYALKNIFLEVTRGEIVGIVGKNGSGKSTLLKIICRITAPSAGRIEVQGKISALLELGAGFNPEYTGIENVYLNGTILGYSKKEIETKLDEILSFADIGDYVYQPVKTYSSGMLVRLAFAVAITVDPDILVVDEALSVGDALFQRKCFSKLESLIDDGKTVLFVSHSLDTVAQLCSRAVLIDAGEILLDTKPKLVRNYYYKLLYSSQAEYQKTRQEIVGVNRDQEYLKRLEKEQDRHDEAGDSAGVGKAELAEKVGYKKDLFLPDFVSQSRVEDRKFPVDIHEVGLKNSSGEIVNYISTNEHYTFSIKVKFQIAAQKVSFNLIFRTISGFTVSTAQAPGRYPFQYLEQVQAGEEYSIDWHFKCTLLTGTYCATVTVLGSPAEGQRAILNRIIDAFVFKVQDAPNSRYGGLVHLEQHAEIKKI